MKIRSFTIAALLALGNASGCGEARSGDDDGGPGGNGSGTDTDHPSGDGCTSLDILFVLDNSPSMVEEQENLAANFAKFVDVIDAFKTQDGSGVAYRVGVTIVDVTRNFKQKIPGFGAMPMSTTGPDGALQGRQKCNLGEHPWIDGPAADAATKFSCLSDVGIEGSGSEMPLAALEGALGKQSEPGGRNEGFYDKGGSALLVAIFITDEDDCSIENGGIMAISMAGSSDCNEATSTGLYDVGAIKTWLDGVTGGAGRSVVVGIAGDTQGGCTSDFGEANYAKRLKKFVDLFADHGFFGDICAGDLWVPLEAALGVIESGCGSLPPVE
ncbi:MAG: hypothetical protein PHU25_13565 [Deltaproteobacteria bacterium]|nr:hypothetical protein [Deltaproteobacteria bacterium]